MKLIRKTGETAAPLAESRFENPRPLPWKLLVIDDEPDVLRLTALNLKDFRFAGRALQLLDAASAAEAKERLWEHPDIAVALVDVVMETEDAGLKLVEHIRGALRNDMIRLIVRTGQPGAAPERYVIDHFDIDDYKDKTELTSSKLYTAVRSALKAYRDLQTIELNRRGLNSVLEATPQLYRLQRETLEAFFEGLLLQVIGLCKLIHTGLISTIDGLLTTLDGDGLHVRAGTGDLQPRRSNPERLNEIVAICSKAVLENVVPDGLREGAMIAPLNVRGQAIGFIYLEVAAQLTDSDRMLILVMANQCSAALENFRLHSRLRDSYEQLIETLALTAEFKDSATGAHIRRIAVYTLRIALAMGLSPALASEFSRASRLHDVGKVGIPDAILCKEGRLTPDEFEIIKRHTVIGAAMLSRNPMLAMAREIALSHHERWDGQGYPNGLAGEDIPQVSRIVAVADVFDALVNPRPYKAAWPAEQAIREIERKSGCHFDPQVAHAMIELYRRGELDDLLAQA